MPSRLHRLLTFLGVSRYSPIDVTITWKPVSEVTLAAYRAEILAFLGVRHSPPFDWSHECPTDVGLREWPPIVGGGRGRIWTP